MVNECGRACGGNVETSSLDVALSSVGGFGSAYVHRYPFLPSLCSSPLFPCFASYMAYIISKSTRTLFMFSVPTHNLFAGRLNLYSHIFFLSLSCCVSFHLLRASISPFLLLFIPSRCSVAALSSSVFAPMCSPQPPSCLTACTVG